MASLFNIKNISKTIICTLTLSSLIACGVFDRRSAGSVVDDNTTNISGFAKVQKVAEADGGHVTVTSYNLHVLITGEVPSHQAGVLIEEKIKVMPKVEKVYNELIVAPAASFSSRANDSFITTKVKSLFLTLGVLGFDPTRVKVITERGTVNLMGIVTRDEAQALIAKAGNVQGVKNVAHFFQYFTEKK